MSSGPLPSHDLIMNSHIREKPLLKFHKIENYTIKSYNRTNDYPFFFSVEASLVQAKLLGLGPRYFFSHYPGH